jgi:threonyl-tRNA synthetase
VEEFYTAFGFVLKPRLSLHDPKKAENYLGAHEEWLTAEQILRDIAKEKNVTPVEAVGEAAFYGPKLDFLAKDSLGREWQVATIQLDFNMPGRFHLTCINEQGEQETVRMLHVAIMGAIERFLSILIEHLAGAFPLWLAPVQIQVIPVSDKHNAHCLGLAQALQKQGLRAEVDTAGESVGKKIRNAEKMKIPYMLVVGDKETESPNLTIRKRGEKETFELSKDLFIERVLGEIQKKVL